MIYSFSEEELNHLKEVIGTLAIDQFVEQEEYRVVIDLIFEEWKFQKQPCSK
tara:strand:+ start:9304 stop:9459 length:156 start_codon:yes stop_codon:yes gene_type:complete